MVHETLQDPGVSTPIPELLWKSPVSSSGKQPPPGGLPAAENKGTGLLYPSLAWLHQAGREILEIMESSREGAGSPAAPGKPKEKEATWPQATTFS